MFTVLWDSREQKPWEFQCSKRKALDFGDYTLRGMEKMLRVERKASMLEIASNMQGSARERYESIYARLGKLRWGFMVLEEDLTGLGHPLLAGKQEAVLRYLTRIEVEHGVRVKMFRNRENALRWVRALFHWMHVHRPGRRPF